MAKFRGSATRPASVASIPVRVMFWLVVLLFLAPALVALALRAAAGQPHWSDASHAASGQAPEPSNWPSAVVQVYAARTWGVRGAIAVHTWIATKREDADHYLRHEVIGWRLRTGSAVVTGPGKADAEWFSNAPQLLTDLRGEGVETVIDKIEQAVSDYPYAKQYRMWPGPNSNTFVAFVARRVPELRLELPPTAIGKDYLGHRLAQTAETAHASQDQRANGEGESPRRASPILFDQAPSGTGFQLSLFGVAGLLAARREGIEVNVLGLVAGARPWPLAIKLPGLGTWPAAEAYRNRAPSDA